MNVLGINAYHGGASAALVVDGELVAAAEEERFERVKYWAGFPAAAIRWCLAEAGLEPADLDHVAISRDPRANVHRKILWGLKRRPNLSFVKDRLKNLATVQDLPDAFSEAVGVDPDDLDVEYHNVEHHRAHMASAFFVSPFEDAAILSFDGMGDFVSTMWGTGSGNRIEVDGAIYYPHSLGYVYTMVTQWLGFPWYGDEGKVMGLAPYGTPRHLDAMREVVKVHDEGTFELDLSYLRHDTEGVEMSWAGGRPEVGRIYSDRFVERIGPAREPGAPIEPLHEDVAASLQAMLEEAGFAMLEMLHRETGSTRLCLAGGVAMNSVFNGKIRLETPFEEVWIQPAAGDAGTSLGAAFWVLHQELGRPRGFVMRDSYTGPAYGADAIAAALDAAGLEYDTLEEGALCAAAAESIAAGDVVGWFQGRMEWGARALGNRSILGDPRRADMKDVLNARIKNREPFRPFAPSVLVERVGEWFEQDVPDPFMLKVYQVREERRGDIPAVTHVDGSGRLQTVDREIAPRYWALIRAFEERTGVPIVLNTSFNENEPIVRTPEEAIDCFLRTRMDALAIGDHWVRKDRQGGDA